MEYDERFGLVHRGTPGVRGGAVVRDVDAEIAVLSGFADRAWMTLDEREELAALVRLRGMDSDQLFYAREERAGWLEGAVIAERVVEEERRDILARMKWQKLSGIRNDVLWPLEAKLSALAPWRWVIQHGQRKRDEREDMEADDV